MRSMIAWLLILTNWAFGQAASPPTPAAGAGQSRPGAKLRVEVINGSQNDQPVADQVFTVIIETAEKVLAQLEGQTDSQGQALVEAPAGQFATVRVRFHDIAFMSESVALKNETPPPLRVYVYEASPDNSLLQVDTHQLICKAAENGLLITEYLRLTNPSRFAISARQVDSQGSPIVLPIMLPTGYRDFTCSSYFQREALVFTPTGFFDTMAIAPGSYDIVFSYILPLTSDHLEVRKEFTVPTQAVTIYLALTQGQMEGLGAPAGQVTLADGADSSYWMLGAAPAGKAVTFHLRGLSFAATEHRSWYILAGAFAILLGLIVYRIRRGRPAKNLSRQSDE